MEYVVARKLFLSFWVIANIVIGMFAIIVIYMIYKLGVVYFWKNKWWTWVVVTWYIYVSEKVKTTVVYHNLNKRLSCNTRIINTVCPVLASILAYCSPN